MPADSVIKNLDFSRNKVSKLQLQIIFDLIKCNNLHVDSLDLSSTNIKEDGAPIIAELLANNIINKLNLSKK